MFTRILDDLRSMEFRKRIGIAILISAAIWIAFFDSHSLARRYSWHKQADRLARENESMRAEIVDLSEQIQSGLSDETIERIARDEYGMRRPGQTVYRVETKR